MILYVESSALLAWILGEPAGELLQEHLTNADQILTSDLTLVECDRALVRGARLGLYREEEADRRRHALATLIGSWHRLRLTEAILHRARQPFPVEPIRTLDALHLASALSAQPSLPDLQILSLDNRIRENAARLLLPLLPSSIQ